MTKYTTKRQNKFYTYRHIHLHQLMIGHNGKQFFGFLFKISYADNVRRCWIRRRRSKVGEQSTPNFRVVFEQISLQKSNTDEYKIRYSTFILYLYTIIPLNLIHWHSWQRTRNCRQASGQTVDSLTQ